MGGDRRRPHAPTAAWRELTASTSRPTPPAGSSPAPHLSLPGDDGETPSEAIPSTCAASTPAGRRCDVGAGLDGEDADRAINVIRAWGLVPPGELATDDMHTVRDNAQRIVALVERISNAACDTVAGHGHRRRALYAVALHRLLRWWLPGYDPALHLGGIGYLFLRGMAGPDVHSLSLATWVGPDYRRVRGDPRTPRRRPVPLRRPLPARRGPVTSGLKLEGPGEWEAS